MSTVCTFYAGDGISFLNLRFENDVKMYGTQTCFFLFSFELMFENDVKMYGTQTCKIFIIASGGFENDVKMYGTQTKNNRTYIKVSLRMM